MSLTREIKLSLDLALMEEVAKGKGMSTSHKGKVHLYTENRPADLVIQTKRAYSIDFVQNPDGTVSSIYDHMIDDIYTDLMQEYYLALIQKKAQGRFKVQSTTKDGTKIQIVLRG